jgi:hypothetical protein
VFQELLVDGGPVLLEQHDLGLHFFEIFMTSRAFPSPQNGVGNAKETRVGPELGFFQNLDRKINLTLYTDSII